MRFYRNLAVLTCCINVEFTPLAQTNTPKQQQPNDNGIVGDTGEEADQPVSIPVTGQTPRKGSHRRAGRNFRRQQALGPIHGRPSYIRSSQPVPVQSPPSQPDKKTPQRHKKTTTPAKGLK